MTKPPKVIGVSGKARHGKDLCAKLIAEIVENDYGAKTAVWSLAHALKARVYAESMGALSFDEVWNTKPPAVRKALQEAGTEKGRMVFGEDFWLFQAEAYIRLLQEAAGVGLVIVPDIRFPNEVEFAQMGGQAPSGVRKRCYDAARSLHFLDTETEMSLLSIDPIRLLEIETAVDDTYANLIESEKSLSEGICIRIVSNRPTLEGDAATHPSETALDNFSVSRFDHVVHNGTEETIEGLKIQLQGIVDGFMAYERQ